MPPKKRVRIAETTSLYINRISLESEVLGMITQPVLIVQGEKNELCPMKCAEHLKKHLSGVANGAILYDVKGGTSMISVVPGYSSIVNNVFVKFLSRLPHHRSDIISPRLPIEERMNMALQTLSEITDKDTTSSDPMSSMSFSCLKEDLVTSQTELINHYNKGTSTALAPNIHDGTRRFSQKKKEEEREQSLYIEKSRLSITNTSMDRVSQGMERRKKIVTTTTIVSKHTELSSPHDPQAAKANFYSVPASEKQVIKRSKTKVP